ncbi:MAG: tRNA 2-thiouridine(34) synthase MnmA [Phycisphaeraceae bacterium]|nr:tRNA 2-thiouridine(34) synthase MnmA [Phycisphaeraceae bacterium]
MSGVCSKSKVLVAMSGGVDSSVAAALLQEQGYEVVGCFMRLGSDDSVEGEACDPNAYDPDRVRPGHQGCCSLDDASDARLVASMLGVPFYVLNFKRDFDRVIDYFVDEYNRGRTPNPCIRCNHWLKFGRLADYARSIDADFVATGHYARVDRDGGRARLMCGRDREKDQSYVLFTTPAALLEHIMLPIGRHTKREVRRIAEEKGLPVFDKPDSQEICFVPDTDYARLVRRRSPETVREGNILDHEGTVIGRHPGHQHFTIGQRRGISVSLGHPIYVTDKNAETNTITVAPASETFADTLVADETNWLRPPPSRPMPCLARIRYNAAAVPATVVAESDTMTVRFDEPQRAISPGQAVVCYEDDELIGGGWIRDVEGTKQDVAR